MKKQVKYIAAAIMFLAGFPGVSQIADTVDNNSGIAPLFRDSSALPLKLNYSIKEMQKETNDSTYMDSRLSYLEDGSWVTLDVNLRARGNFRRDRCYTPPVKIKLQPEHTIGTLFEGNKSLKLVLPCFLVKRSNDDITKEYLAYKLYEAISPYHFKTRLVHIDFTEQRTNKTIDHWFKGILIEDDKNVARRCNGRIIDRIVHPLQQDAVTSLQNDFFQYMIGNTDFSSAYQHNQKLLFIDNKIMPIPYDFDMAGLVDASYAVVSQVQNETLDITDVKDRRFRGFQREPVLMQKVRMEILDKKPLLMEIVDGMASNFDDAGEFVKSKKYLEDFFWVLVNESAFKREILDRARTK